MRLFIAEKPNLARAIAAGLPQPVKKQGQALLCGNSDVVVWCAGHIMQQVNPDAYDPKYKAWNLEDLPIIPQTWQLKVSTPELFKTIKSHMINASLIVNAGDPDKEGQLLVDEVIEYIGTNAPVKRILVSDLNLPAVKKALLELQDNADFKGLSDSALARSRADWLYGINMTRLYTQLGRKGGYTEVLSVGRVQTPLLGLVVRRDKDIKDFKSKPFFSISAEVKTANGAFIAVWKANQQADLYLDEEGRLIDPAYASQIEKKITNKNGIVNSLEIKDKKEQPPLCFALKDLQILASKKLNFSPDKTLEIIQALYETHKIITYPRSDCSYLPLGHTDDIKGVFNAINIHFSGLSVEIDGADFGIRSKVWNDKKITAHHAIIPTQNTNKTNLSNDETLIYELIAFRYILQFYPNHEYQQTNISVLVEDEKLTATGRVILKNGWKSVEKNSNLDDENSQSNFPDDLKSLPRVQESEKIFINSSQTITKNTKPPLHFTDATLLAAMGGISRYVTNPEIKKILKDTDGLGTPATQASIIKTLFDRNFLVKQGKNILSTEVGKTLIAILPADSTVPDMTALWEMAMSKIERSEIDLNGFIQGVEKQLTLLIENGKALGKLTIAGVKFHNCPKCKEGILNRRKGSNGFFWGCSNFPECKQTYQDEKGSPQTTPSPEFDCPTCKKGKIRKRKGANGIFWGCTAFKEGCKQSFNDYRGKPDFDNKAKSKSKKSKFTKKIK